MRRFQFRLQSVLDWRIVQRDLEEAKLQGLFAEIHRIDAAIEALGREEAEAERAVAFSPSVEAQQLTALEEHKRYAAAETVRLRRQRLDCEKRIAVQREKLVKAERDLRLLERLKERRLAEWTFEFNREQEALASELFLGRWHRG
jgi:flagellar FliJ protein